MKKYILMYLLPAVALAGAQPLAAQETGRSLWSDYRLEADQASDDYGTFRNLAADDQQIRTQLSDA
ncbi:MAG: hypothetical protein AAGB22_14425, partial [Bacteroidota bacterium]